jgi:hypothetical protein
VVIGIVVRVCQLGPHSRFKAGLRLRLDLEEGVLHEPVAVGAHVDPSAVYVEGTVELHLWIPVGDREGGVLGDQGSADVVVEEVAFAHPLPGHGREGVAIGGTRPAIGDFACAPTNLGASEVGSGEPLLGQDPLSESIEQ